MVSFEKACEYAQEVSAKYPDLVYRVYRTPSGNHWVRQDDEPRTSVEGIKLVFLAAFLGGVQVRP